MKRIIICSIILILVTVTAQADFLDDFNFYAESLYGIKPVKLIDKDSVRTKYESDSVILFIQKDNSIFVSSENHLDAISAACCVLRCIDSTGNRIDQYGRILHAYYLSKTDNGKCKHRHS